MVLTVHDALDDFESCVNRINNTISCFLLKVNEVDCAIEVVKSLLISLDYIGDEQARVTGLAIEPALGQLKEEMGRLISVVEEGIRRILGLAGLLADEVRQRLLLLNNVVGHINPGAGRLHRLSASLGEMESQCATILFRSTKQLTTLGLMKFQA